MSASEEIFGQPGYLDDDDPLFSILLKCAEEKDPLAFLMLEHNNSLFLRFESGYSRTLRPSNPEEVKDDMLELFKMICHNPLFWKDGNVIASQPYRPEGGISNS